MTQRKNYRFDNIKIGASLLIENVTLVDGLKYNLLSISQLCDKGLKVIFDTTPYRVVGDCDIYLLIGCRGNRYVYILVDNFSRYTWVSSLNTKMRFFIFQYLLQKS